MWRFNTQKTLYKKKTHDSNVIGSKGGFPLFLCSTTTVCSGTRTIPHSTTQPNWGSSPRPFLRIPRPELRRHPRQPGSTAFALCLTAGARSAAVARRSRCRSPSARSTAPSSSRWPIGSPARAAARSSRTPGRRCAPVSLSAIHVSATRACPCGSAPCRRLRPL